MEKNEKIEKIQHSPRVHKILAQSYLVYFLALFIGLVLSAIFPAKISVSSILLNLSAVVLILSSILIYWAQKSTKNFKKDGITKNAFKKGPYKFLRNPTNTGLFLLLLSFGIIINSIFVVFLTLVAFVFANFIFLRKEQKLLEKKYGEAYIEYKRDVRF